MEQTQVDWGAGRGGGSQKLEEEASREQAPVYLFIYSVCSSTLRSITVADTALTGKHTLCPAVGTREGAWGN